jgi:hypothetical protein
MSAFRGAGSNSTNQCAEPKKSASTSACTVHFVDTEGVGRGTAPLVARRIMMSLPRRAARTGGGA